MEAVVLVGGLGTRLGELTKSIPKPMLPIRGIPFLERLLTHLKANGFTKVILAVGYKSEVIKSFFSNSSTNVPEIAYSTEASPLGTGGAIAQALDLVSSRDVFVLNGDSFLELDYGEMYRLHRSIFSDLTIASYFVEIADRYDLMAVTENQEVVGFQEKGKLQGGLINGGVYLLNVERFRKVFASLPATFFSFEEVIVSNPSLGLKKIHYETKGTFLDIGIISDFEYAQELLFK